MDKSFQDAAYAGAVSIQRRWRGYFQRSQSKTAKQGDANNTTKSDRERDKPAQLALSPSKRKCSSVSGFSSVSREEGGSLKFNERIPFSKDKDLVVLVDGAVHLPPTTTATRLHAALYMPNKQQVPDSAVTAMCEMQSNCYSPQFSMRIRWKGAMLHPTMTIVVRIDTLEAPHLEPRTVGHAAIRVCVNSIGMQPLSEVVYDSAPSIFFNAGQFMAPVLYGMPFAAEELEFLTETKMHEHCVHIENAFLRVGLLSVAPNKAIPSTPFSAMTIDATRRPSQLKLDGLASLSESSSSSSLRERERDAAQGAALHGASLSAASVLLRGYLSLSLSHCETKRLSLSLSLSERVVQRFVSLAALDGEEVERTLSLLRDACERVFSERDPKNAFVNVSARYLVPYDVTHGALLSLNMLHNMPLRRRLVGAAQRAGAVKAMQSGLTRGWDNKINAFKTIFRYLPGAPAAPLCVTTQGAVSVNGRDDTFDRERERERKHSFVTDFDHPEQPVSLLSARSRASLPLSLPVTQSPPSPAYSAHQFGPDYSESVSLVVDDASLRLSALSSERCPEYQDDFSSTAGLALGPHACLLVIVTAVDVLTTRRAAPPAAKPAAVSTLTSQREASLHPLSLSLTSPRDSFKSSLGGLGEREREREPSLSARSHVTTVAERSARASKLRGLRGVYVAKNEPKHTYWGLLPLFVSFPASHTVLSPSTQTHTQAMPAAQSPLTMQRKSVSASPHNALTQTALSKDFVEKNYSQFLQGEGQGRSPTAAPLLLNLERSTQPTHKPPSPHMVPTTPTSHSPCTTALLPPQLAAQAQLLFVQDGVHQVPLFQGLPPPQMVLSADPFAWLVSQLGRQLSRSLLRRTQWSACLGRVLCAPLRTFSALSRFFAGAVRRRRYQAVHAAQESEHGGEDPAKERERENTKEQRERESDTQREPELGEDRERARERERDRKHAELGLSERGSAWFTSKTARHTSRLSLHTESVDLEEEEEPQHTHGKTKESERESEKNKQSKTKKSNNKKDKKTRSRGAAEDEEELVLSPGCSAVVRVADPRLKRLVAPPVSLAQHAALACLAHAGGGRPHGSDIVLSSSSGIGSGYNNNNNNHSALAIAAGGAGGGAGLQAIQESATNDILFLMSHVAVSHEDELFEERDRERDELDRAVPREVSLQFDERQFKRLQSTFRVQGVSHALAGDKKKLRALRGRTFCEAIPDTVDKDALLQEINNKFYESLSG